MAKVIPPIFFFLLIVSACNSQEEKNSHISTTVEDPVFDRSLKGLLDFTVPLAEPKDLMNIQGEVFIFDTRNEKEYDISHIPGAVFLGYEDPDWNILENTPLDSPIILYCSVGYRSEKTGEKLKEMGYTNVRNLYGGIFSWVNLGLPIEDLHGDESRTVHTYNALWGRFVKAPGLKKIW